MRSGRRGGRGFTLVELMVIVAIVGVLSTVAVIGVSRTGYSRGVQGLAAEIAALAEVARTRAIANHRWQQIEYDEDARAILHWEVDYRGMRPPTTADTWNRVRVLSLPADLEVAAMDDKAHDQSDSGVSAGTFDTATVHFLPDGTVDGSDAPGSSGGVGATLFIRGGPTKERARVIVFPATGASYALDGW